MQNKLHRIQKSEQQFRFQKSVCLASIASGHIRDLGFRANALYRALPRRAVALASHCFAMLGPEQLTQQETSKRDQAIAVPYGTPMWR